MSVDKMSANSMSVYKMAAGNMFADKISLENIYVYSSPDICRSKDF